MNISVFGAGYVGLVQAAVFAHSGHHVFCIDTDSSRLRALTAGQLPFHEPGLQELVDSGISSDRLQFSDNAVESIQRADLLIIAVGTPSLPDGSANLEYVQTVAHQIAEYAVTDKIILCKSTVPVGTCDQLQEMLNLQLCQQHKDISLEVVSNPEFLKQGNAVNDCLKPDRIVIGTECSSAQKTLSALFAPYCRSHDRLLFMSRRSAEMTKYAANCFLATKISFMNEMAAIAEASGADIESVRLAMGADPRIGYQFIYPGLGYGGSCFPKDVKALAATARNVDIEPGLLAAVDARNKQQQMDFFNKVSEHFGHQLQGLTFAIWGLSFKPDTSDMREAPARYLMEKLWQAGARVQAHDPQASDECRRIYPDQKSLSLTDNSYEALEGCETLIICTEWSEYRSPDFSRIKQNLSKPVIFDGRNLWSPEEMKGRGFIYHSIGRKSITLY
ncbi:UDP-glucose 6-dehydrogenase [Endozoicomonas sp. OPT23]|uniref:UDP-glucose dehydrogenase family protein n=1 Tax=Endozoicomonas sp. OPT23 TaxID=2072845 RepID=UPI00129ACAFB|nr:UDP-glucose/GDP-mannose dehydrogenase family protein [Endozoicomonas sp. OPT23]MRI33075.1 UDP-glucose 6-dehydrogenase [Endozoicomonas sp. OPT23]